MKLTTLTPGELTERGRRLSNKRKMSEATKKTLEKKIAKAEVEVRMSDKLVEEMQKELKKI